MDREQYLNLRKDILSDVDDILKGCEGCQIHFELNAQKKITELTNVCKACPIGILASTRGKKLLDATNEYRNNKHNH